jgi:hypothetical protein
VLITASCRGIRDSSVIKDNRVIRDNSVIRDRNPKSTRIIKVATLTAPRTSLAAREWFC